MANVIVVGVDGGQPSFEAAKRAAELAASMGAALHVVSAVTRGDVQEYRGRPDLTLSTPGEIAEAIASDVAGSVAGTVSEISYEIVSDKPSAALVSEAQRLQASLIVIGNRHAQGLGRMLGSVASSVVAHAPCDVYIVKTF